MKRLLSLLAAIVVIAGLLWVAKADVNHGHGPDAEGQTQSEH